MTDSGRPPETAAESEEPATAEAAPEVAANSETPAASELEAPATSKPSPGTAANTDSPAIYAPAPGAITPTAKPRGRCRRGFDAFERLIAFATDTIVLLVAPVIYSIALGAGGWWLLNPKYAHGMADNQLVQRVRLIQALWVGGAALLLLTVYLARAGIQKFRTGAFELRATTLRLNRSMAFVLAMPFVAALTVPGIESKSPRQTALWALVAAIAVGASAYHFVARAPKRQLPLWFSRGLAGSLVAGLWGAYAWVFSTLSIGNHRALRTSVLDLGLYDNIFYQSIHGRFLGCSFIKAGYHGSAHFAPLLVMLSPLYLLYPRAEFLLVLQAVWLGSGAVPVYLLTFFRSGSRWMAIALSACWVLTPAMHGANMYDFHSLTLIAPLVVWLLYFFEKGKTVAYYLMLALLLLCREDVSLLMAFVGIYSLLCREPARTRQGWVTILVSAVYLVTVKTFFMTSSDIFMSGKESYSFAYYYKDLIPKGAGLGGLLVSLLTNPSFVIESALSEKKQLFLLVIFAPLLFLPLLALRGRVMLVYGLLFCLLASRTPVFTAHFQYSCILFPIAFALTPNALARLREGSLAARFNLRGPDLTRAAVVASLVCALLMSWKFGGILENKSFRGGFTRVNRELSPAEQKRYQWVEESAAQIPYHASVGTTDRLGPHVSNRRHVYLYPNGEALEYLLVDEAKLKKGKRRRHRAALKRGEYEELSRLGTLALFRRTD